MFTGIATTVSQLFRSTQAKHQMHIADVVDEHTVGIDDRVARLAGELTDVLPGIRVVVPVIELAAPAHARRTGCGSSVRHRRSAQWRNAWFRAKGKRLDAVRDQSTPPHLRKHEHRSCCVYYSNILFGDLGPHQAGALLLQPQWLPM
jgi:hypothetical protein